MASKWVCMICRHYFRHCRQTLAELPYLADFPRFTILTVFFIAFVFALLATLFFTDLVASFLTDFFLDIACTAFALDAEEPSDFWPLLAGDFFAAAGPAADRLVFDLAS